MATTNESDVSRQKTRRVREDGVRSRRAILDAAARLATVEGLAGLSIARLADKAGISKSGLFAHFGSKEELQLATIDAAREIYQREIFDPALDEPDPLARLKALCERFLAMVGGDLFPGGCFFSSVNAEFDTRPGPVLDRLIELDDEWVALLAGQVEAARAAGQLSPTVDPEQVAFDLNAFLHAANEQFVLRRDRAQLDRARHSIDAYLAVLTAGADR
ncbi:TetR/AcrR family transcriptional regulator [Actinoplanes sp. TBRC 11911]|uniref:TetR/AcrR family transcriptional regulator n=1 Tax=Actinoplanes sp. TBRC 11911 TaxID=2729386 RepID=UPI00145EC366|nr:TetR/AcrR family transcriptional regulator [Actinoplanes sp. TBRC 11911]NMO56348.1 TetR/AcrR family transcriptional regulator [Actinoplanes sp. TBRC 11911]